MLTIVAILQQLEELVHQLVVLGRDAVKAVQLGMKVKEIEDHRLQRVDEHLAIEVVLRLGQSLADGSKIGSAPFLHGGSEPHDWIVEQ